MSNIACVFAHPDDEAFGPGGTIAKFSRDHNVYIICCTNKNHSLRHDELLESAKVLGVKKVIFLDFEDGELSNNKYPLLVSRLKIHLQKLRPSIIITFHPNGVSGHIDHMAVTSVINYLFDKLKFIKKIMYFCMRDSERKLISDYFVHMPAGYTKNDVDEIIDISDVLGVKEQAAQKHKSQLKDMIFTLTKLKLLPKEEYFQVKSR